MAEPVTLRFPTPITLPYHDAVRTQVTLRYEETPQPAGAATFARGEVLVDAYRVEQGPLEPQGGEGEVYRCRSADGSELAVKLYRETFAPKAEVMEELFGLAHPNIVRLLDYGNWGGRFYEVTGYCSGGSLAQAVPFDETALRQVLSDVLAALDYCHRRGIVHRDLKPTNLLFVDEGRERVMLGDFGISSRLQDGGAQITRSAVRMTLDYAAPEMLDGHQVSHATDYYALGITLLHLLIGQSPFDGWSANDILVAHLRGAIPRRDGIDASLRPLIAGLTHREPQSRWGLREVEGWLGGVEVPVIQSPALSVESPGYPGFPAARTPAELAAALEQFDAAKQLLRGDIRRWVFDHFSAEMAERIEPLETLCASDARQALSRLAYLLDPRRPLICGDHRITTLHALADLLQNDPKAISDGWKQRAVESWIEASRAAGARSDELVARIETIRERLPFSRDTALFALLYTIDPSKPVQLEDGSLLYRPDEIGECYRTAPKMVLQSLAHLLFSHRLEEWMRGARFDGWEEDVRFLEQRRREYLEKKAMGAWCALWRFAPDIPFPFDGRRFTSARELAIYMDRSPRNTALGRKLLEKGWLRVWLLASGRINHPADLDHLLLALDVSPEARFESVLQLLAPELDSPGFTVSPQRIDFGRLRGKERHTRTLLISAFGRGHLYGEIILERYGEGITLDAFRIEGAKTEIEVQLNTLGLEPRRYTNHLTLRTNGGERQVELHYRILPPEPEKSWWQSLRE